MVKNDAESAAYAVERLLRRPRRLINRRVVRWVSGVCNCTNQGPAKKAQACKGGGLAVNWVLLVDCWRSILAYECSVLSSFSPYWSPSMHGQVLESKLILARDLLDKELLRNMGFGAPRKMLQSSQTMSLTRSLRTPTS